MSITYTKRVFVALVI